MFGWSNPFTALFRMFNWRAQPLAAATANAGTRVSAPFISNVSATTPIVANATGGNANIRFIACDALGIPDTTNAVRVTFSAESSTTAVGAVTSGTIVTTEQGLGADATTVTIIPGTGGLVSFIAGFGGAEANAKFAIQSRHIIAAAEVAVT